MSVSMELRRKLLEGLVKRLEERRDQAKKDMMIPEYNRMCVTIVEIQILSPNGILKAVDVLVDNDIATDENEAKALIFDSMIWG